MSCLPPLSALVSLHLGNSPSKLTFAQWRHTLTMSNQLQDLHINEDVLLLQLFPAVEIPSLYSLTFTPCANLYNQMVSIKCSALQHLIVEPHHLYNTLLELSGAPRDSDPSSPSMYPSLQSLTLQHVTITRIEAYWFIANLPSITHIIIDSCTDPDILLNFLVPTDAHKSNSEIHWPLLQTIGLSGMESTATLEVLYKIVSDCMSRGIPLVSAQLASMGISPDMLDWLRE